MARVGMDARRLWTYVVRMRRFAAIPLILLASCATAAAGPIQQLGFQGERPEVKCDIEIVFSSACCGINAKAHEGVTRLLGARSEVQAAVEWNWGREGERTICVAARTPAAAGKLFTALTAQKYPATNHAATNVTYKGRQVGLE